MLKIRNLYVSYGDREILRGIDFSARQGEIVAVVGESGTGKTTLAMSIIGLLQQYDAHSKVKGQIIFDRKDLCQADQIYWKEIRWKQISMVFQNVDNILNPTMTVYQQLSEVAYNNKNRIEQYLDKVGFPVNRASDYPHQLSMGEKQRLLIAMAYISDPRVVILDEPTSALDYESKQEVIETIKGLSQSKSVILVTHDLETARKLSDKTLVLYGGMIVEFGPTKDVLSDPKHPYTRGLSRSYPSEDRTKDLQGIRGQAEFVKKGCPFWPRCTQSLEICKLEKPELRISGPRQIACHRGGIIALLKARDINKSFKKINVLQNISLEVYEGETVTLLGRSGSGKTTLAKIIMGLVKPDNGRIYLETREVEKWDFNFYSKVQMIFQDIRSAISHRLNVLEAVMEPLLVKKWGDRQQQTEKVRQVLAEVQLPNGEGFLHSYPHHLSGGELQRIAIARALVLSPKLIIADEPTSSLDASIQAKILKLLNQIQEQRGLGMLFITHDLGVAKKVSDRILRLEEGFLSKD